MQNEILFKGSCLCSKIKYELSQEPFDCSICHCCICRKLTGSGFGAYGAVNRSHFKWLTCSDEISQYSPTPISRRYFCGTCGSYLATDHDGDPSRVYLSLGCLDSELATQPEHQQFAGAIPGWSKLHDNLSTYEKWPD